MKIYNMGTGGLWVGILVLLFFVMSFLALGGFLLGTPIGLAILTLLVIRHFYRRYQRRRYQNAQDNETVWQKEPESESNSSFTDDLATKYKQSEQEIKIFSSEDRQNAVDVEFKEL